MLPGLKTDIEKIVNWFVAEEVNFEGCEADGGRVKILANADPWVLHVYNYDPWYVS